VIPYERTAIMTGCFFKPHRELTLFKHVEEIKKLPNTVLKMLITHTPIHHKIYDAYDIVLYDRNNVADEDRQFSYGAAESMLIKQGLMVANYYHKEWMIKLGFDLIPDEIERVFDWFEFTPKHKMVSMTHGRFGVGTLAFLVNVKWGLKNLPEFRTIDEMFQGKEGQHLEFAIGKHLVKRGVFEDVYRIENGINKMFKQIQGCPEYCNDNWDWAYPQEENKNLLKRFKGEL